jgi:hypothetical protein
MSLSSDLASLENEIESLRAEVKILREARAVTDFENADLKHRLAKAEARNSVLLMRETTLKTIVRQTGAGLVDSITKYTEETKDNFFEPEPRKAIADERKGSSHA